MRKLNIGVAAVVEVAEGQSVADTVARIEKGLRQALEAKVLRVDTFAATVVEPMVGPIDNTAAAGPSETTAYEDADGSPEMSFS